MIQEDTTLYNQITVKNIDNEDFIFRVKTERYLIRAGESKIYPKFMVRPFLKHLIDKILIKRDPQGKLLRRMDLREELARQIVLNEAEYEKPVLPTDRELVNKMNKGEPELDRILEKNRSRLKGEESVLTAPPKVDTAKIQTPPSNQPLVAPVVSEPKTPETENFDQIENEKKTDKIPPRQEMLDYAKNTLKMDLDEPKTKKAWDKMSDEKLFVELGLDKEEDLVELGFK